MPISRREFIAVKLANKKAKTPYKSAPRPLAKRIPVKKENAAFEALPRKDTLDR